VDPDADWRLLPDSIARQTGPWGLDRGAYVPGGAAVQGVPDPATWPTTVVLTVGGPGIRYYKYALNTPDGFWSAERSVDVPILLDGLEPGHSYAVYVLGKDSAGRWQSLPAKTTTWTVDCNFGEL